MFVSDQEAIINKILKLLNPGGQPWLIVENRLNAMAINILNNNTKEAIKINNTNFGKITETIPELHYNMVDDIERYCIKHGLTINNIIGSPIVTIIGVKRNNDKLYPKLKYIIKKYETYNELLETEKQLSSDQRNSMIGKYILFWVIKND